MHSGGAVGHRDAGRSHPHVAQGAHQPEIADLNVAADNHNVLRLDVAMLQRTEAAVGQVMSRAVEKMDGSGGTPM